MKEQILELFDQLTEEEQNEVIQFCEDMMNDNVDNNPLYNRYKEYLKQNNID